MILARPGNKLEDKKARVLRAFLCVCLREVGREDGQARGVTIEVNGPKRAQALVSPKSLSKE